MTWREYRRQYHTRRIATDPVYREQIREHGKRVTEKAKASLLLNTGEHLRPTLKVGNSGYVNGCRCQGCIAGRNAYKARLRVMRAPELRAKDRQRRQYRLWPESRKRPVYKRQAELRKIREAWVIEIKLTSGCSDCGFNKHACALDFDHVCGDKLFNIGERLCSSRKRLEAEIAKCQVVCANCHRIRTVSRPPARKKSARKQIDLFETPAQIQRREYQKNRILQKRLEGLARLAELKLAKGCSDCGYKAHAAALDFDHVIGTKRFAIASVAHLSPDLIDLEIAKCEVVCANCHRIRTLNRRHS